MSGPVLVRWIDSMSEGGWHQAADAKREAHDVSLEAETVGFIVDETDAWLLLAMGSIHDGSVVHETIQIPKVAVLDVVRLRRGGKL